MDTPKMGELKLSAKNRASKSNFTPVPDGVWGRYFPRSSGLQRANVSNERVP